MASLHAFTTDPNPTDRPRLGLIYNFNEDSANIAGVRPICRNIANFLAHDIGGGYNMTIAISGGAGRFRMVGETITQATSGATATYLWDDGTFIYANYLAGTWTTPGPLTVTGGTSGATRTGAAVVTGLAPVTAAYSAVNGIAAGYKYLELMWINGQKATGNEYGWSHYPFDYPDGSSAGDALNISPLTEVQAEAAFVAAGYQVNEFKNAIKAGFDTAGVVGALYGMYMYMGPTPGNAATDTATLDTYSDLIRHFNCDASYDTNSVGSRTSTAPPTIMQTNCLGWWEADQGAYQSAGSGTPATADTNPVHHWNSITGSAVWTRQTDDANRPLLKTNAVNSRPSLLFDGTSDRMTLASALSLSAEFTIAMVVKSNNVDGMILSKTDANVQMRFNSGGTAGKFTVFSPFVEASSGSGAISNSAWVVLRLRYDGADCRIYQNGVQVASYLAGPAFTTGMAVDMLGAFGNGGVSTFFSGELAALTIWNASATDNQILLVEAYWAAKYAISVTGSPVLPHEAFLERLNSQYSKKGYRENFNYRSVTTLSDWDADSAGIVGVYEELANAITNAATYYTLASIGSGQRARVLVLNNGPSAAVRSARVLAAAALGYDVMVDPGGFTQQELVDLKEDFDAEVDGETPGPNGIPEPLLRLG